MEGIPSISHSSPTQVTTGPSLKEQVLEAKSHLENLQAERADVCKELEEEAKVFLGSQSTPEQQRRFNLIYQLVRFHVSVAGE